MASDEVDRRDTSQGALELLLRASDSERGVLIPTWPDEVASTLHRVGVGPGSKVGVIGFGFSSGAGRDWPECEIVAEMFGWEATPFWKDGSVRAEAIRAFSAAGAAAIVAERVFTDADLTGWHRVGSSHHYIYILD